MFFNPRLFHDIRYIKISDQARIEAGMSGEDGSQIVTELNGAGNLQGTERGRQVHNRRRVRGSDDTLRRVRADLFFSLLSLLLYTCDRSRLLHARLFHSRDWIKSLAIPNYREPHKTPAQRLIEEMNCKGGDVRVLVRVLSDLNMLGALNVLCQPVQFQIICQPTDAFGKRKKILVHHGETISIKCEAFGLPPPRYQWYLNDEALVGQTKGILTLTITKRSQVGRYQCLVRQVDQNGDSTHERRSREITIDMTPIPVRVTEQPPSSVEVDAGGTLKISCGATGYPDNLLFQWYRNNDLIYSHYSDEVVAQENNDDDDDDEPKAWNYSRSVLQIDKCPIESSALYTCRVSNSYSDEHSHQTHVWVSFTTWDTVTESKRTTYCRSTRPSTSITPTTSARAPCSRTLCWEILRCSSPSWTCVKIALIRRTIRNFIERLRRSAGAPVWVFNGTCCRPTRRPTIVRRSRTQSPIMAFTRAASVAYCHWKTPRSINSSRNLVKVSVEREERRVSLDTKSNFFLAILELDLAMRGKLHYQIPMYSTSVTQPFKLIDLPNPSE
ncbi:unnamed protein product [Trichogramma brassicae]|uniref:Ig-like domain-containing protein n=1 Tax=Trichogramma brassicae TaxID=86971 RepID=A0A6H5IAY0_9HYME|nr:unnamed protein product [Trichogramma brassicae]